MYVQQQKKYPTTTTTTKQNQNWESPRKNSLKDNLVTFYDITGVIKTYLRNIKIKTNYVPIILFTV